MHIKGLLFLPQVLSSVHSSSTLPTSLSTLLPTFITCSLSSATSPTLPAFLATPRHWGHQTHLGHTLPDRPLQSQVPQVTWTSPVAAIIPLHPCYFILIYRTTRRSRCPFLFRPASSFRRLMISLITLPVTSLRSLARANHSPTRRTPWKKYGPSMSPKK